MDLQQILTVRKQILEGKEQIPPETLQACVAWLRQGRESARPATKKESKSKEPKKSSEELLRQLGF